MPDLCTSGSQNILTEAVEAGARFQALHGHCQIIQTIQEDLISSCVTCSCLLFQIAIQFPSRLPGKPRSFTWGVLNSSPREERWRGGETTLFPRLSRNPGNFLRKAVVLHTSVTICNLSLVLLISTKGNPWSRSSGHMDLGLFKPYKAARRLPAWRISFLILCEPHSAGSSTYEDARLTHVCLFISSGSA